jgi:hypothetical protein
VSDPGGVSLREHFDEKFAAADRAVSAALAAQEKATAAAFVASEKAISKADVNAEKWRENANEWRSSMLDRENKFAQRAEMEAELKAIRAEVAMLRESRAAGSGRGAGQAAMWGYVVGGFGFVMLLLTIAAAVTSLLARKP